MTQISNEPDDNSPKTNQDSEKFIFYQFSGPFAKRRLEQQILTDRTNRPSELLKKFTPSSAIRSSIQLSRYRLTVGL